MDPSRATARAMVRTRLAGRTEMSYRSRVMANTLAAVATLAKETQASWKQRIWAFPASRGTKTTTAVSGMQQMQTYKQDINTFF